MGWLSDRMMNGSLKNKETVETIKIFLTTKIKEVEIIITTLDESLDQEVKLE